MSTEIQKVRVTHMHEIGWAYIINLKSGKALVGHGYRSAKSALKAGEHHLYSYRKETATND